jgi:hypothetical protein
MRVTRRQLRQIIQEEITRLSESDPWSRTSYDEQWQEEKLGLHGTEPSANILPADTDGDGIPNHLDADDDGDGIPTKDELSAQSSKYSREELLDVIKDTMVRLGTPEGEAVAAAQHMGDQDAFTDDLLKGILDKMQERLLKSVLPGF